jgi:glycosyltransferase involved in cell wall biosynthesis
VRPGGTVVVMAPPGFAPAVVRAFVPRDVAVVVDVHSGAFNDERWRWSFGWMARLVRWSDLALVTNLELVATVDTGATPVVVCHDPLERRVPDGSKVPPQSPRRYVVFPASGAADEPLAAVAGAADLLDEVDVFVTGRTNLRGTGSLVMTGFLADEEYHALIGRAAAVLALTTREATAQRAAYEALEYGRPIVASSTRALRAILGPAAVFVDNDAASIAAGVRAALGRSDELAAAGSSCVDALRTQTATAVRTIERLRSRRQRHRSASSTGS